MPVISFTNSKGGTGKSTLAYSLAFRLAADYKRVLLLDMDSQQTLGDMLEDRRALGLPEVFDYRALFKQPIAVMGPQAAAYRSEYDMVVIDTPARYTTETQVALALADLVLVPTRPSRADFRGLTQIVRELPVAQNEKVPVFTVFNQVRTHPGLHAPKYYADLIKKAPYIRHSGVEMASRVYWERVSLGAAPHEQEPVGHRAVEELEQLYSFVRTQLEKL
jgi:cellulose biosynthesis protein BcsQ